MDVPRVEQHSNGLTATGAGGVGARPGDDPASMASQTSPADVNQDSIAFARVAVFDLKGDGHIDPRSVLDGGDATLLVPEYPLYLSTDARVVPSLGTSGAARSTPSGEISAPVPAAPAGGVRAQAIAAYQRVVAGTAPAAGYHLDSATRRA